MTRLAKVLLINFDNRYAPACSDSGKVKYHREDTIGKYNCYIGIHQYFFVASFLDPQVAPLLSDMMTPDSYNMLKSNVIDFIVAKLKAIDNLFNEMLLNKTLLLQPSLPKTIQNVPS